MQRIPLCTVRAGPLDDKWLARLKEELQSLITYVTNNKKADNDWFVVEPNPNGTKWTGKCWYVHKMVKYEFKLEFELPVGYPVTPFEIVLPELEGKTVKMYRGGKICLSIHFKPLWAKNSPRFGIAHALAMGLAPWLAAEVPYMVESGYLTEKLAPAAPDAAGAAAAGAPSGES